MKAKNTLALSIALLICLFQPVKLDEFIKNDVPALPRQGEMHKSQENIVMSNEPIRPDETKKGPEKTTKVNIAYTPNKTKAMTVTVTAYCKVPKGKGARNRALRKRNGSGITKSGKKVKRGHIAADLSHYPIGTVFYVPGYGRGVVEDSGGKIKGKHHIDIFLDTYSAAIEWGNPKLKVLVQVAKKSKKKSA